MSKKFLFLIPLIFLLISCGGSRRFAEGSAPETSERRKAVSFSTEGSKTEPEVSIETPYFEVCEAAKGFLGTRYSYGGTSKNGMDCSGLIYTAFLEKNIPLPRTARAMSLEGKRVDLEEVQMGDLLFFETNKNEKVINHVALVVAVRPEEISFIHSTTSSGVIISNLNENYWHEHFVMARRLD